MFLFSHLTYLVQLLYLGNLSRPNCHELSLKLIFDQNRIFVQSFQDFI